MVKKMNKTSLYLIFNLFIFILTLNTAYALEVGVVIDTSVSMRRSDAKQYAILATKVLVDILDPTEDDLFVVFFDKNYRGATSTQKHDIIRWNDFKQNSTPGDYTSSFHRELARRSHYDAQCTYFAPSISAGLKEFSGKWGAKLLIFLTDGQSNDVLKEGRCHFSNGVDERNVFDGEINDMILQNHIKVAPLFMLSGNGQARLRSELQQSYFLTFFDQSGRGGEPLQEIQNAIDIPCKFAELLSKTTTRTVECLGALNRAPNQRLLQNINNRGFDVDPAMSRADIISVAGEGFLNGPQSPSSPDVILVQPLPHPPRWLPLKGDFSIGRHASYYGNQRNRNSSYSVLRVKGPGQGQSPYTGHWNIYRDNRTRLRPHSFIVKYYDFAVSLQTQSRRLSIPLDQPICFQAVLTDRNSKNPKGLPANVLQKIEVAFFGEFKKLLGLNLKPGDPIPNVIGKPLKLLSKLEDNGLNADPKPTDSKFNGCFRITAADLGLTADEVKHSHEVLGRLKTKVSVIYNGEPRLYSNELSIEILPPMNIVPEGGGIVELFGEAGSGLGISERQCGSFIFSKDNSKIPEIDNTPFNRFRVHIDGLRQEELKNRPSPTGNNSIDSIFDKMTIVICDPESDDQNLPESKQCKQTQSDPNSNVKLKFPEVPETVYSYHDRTYSALVDLKIDHRYLVCASVGFRFQKTETPDPKSTSNTPVALIFVPDDANYNDRHPAPPKSAAPYAPNGPKWEIRGEVKLHVKLREPTFFEKYWSIIALLGFLGLIVFYFYERKRSLRLPSGLRYKIWDEGFSESSAIIEKVPFKKEFTIKKLGIQLYTNKERIQTVDGIAIRKVMNVNLKERSQTGNYIEVFDNQIFIDRTYCTQIDSKNRYFTFFYDHSD